MKPKLVKTLNDFLQSLNDPKKNCLNFSHLVARLLKGFALRGAGGRFLPVGAAPGNVELVAVIGQFHLKDQHPMILPQKTMIQD